MPQVPKLHIVAFNIPYPSNYGGVIDVFHRIRCLSKEHCAIHLHCFQYGGRKPSPKLEELCEKVSYYKRKPLWTALFQQEPFIVYSRRNDELLHNLASDDHPVIFDGIHCCHYLDHPELAGRVKAVRMHNIEWQYYRGLADSGYSSWRNMYFKEEARRLRSFESRLPSADYILTVTPQDTEYYAKLHPSVHCIPSFHQNEFIHSQTGRGDFAIYHGNLSISENIQAVHYLLDDIFSKLPYKLVIAGLNPPESLVKKIEKFDNVQLKPNLSDEEMLALMRQAHVHVLPTFQPTGLKLKMIYTLFNGRFCVVNQPMVDGTVFGKYCIVTQQSEEMIRAIEDVWQKDFGEEDLAHRREALKDFSNREGARTIMKLLYSPHPQ